ncbi:MAG: tail fiber protein [Ferruginibacter sp.]
MKIFGFIMIVITLCICKISIAQKRVGINTTNPQAGLHVADSSVVFSAPASLPAVPYFPPISGSGNRMMWYADKAAFRVGRVSALQWDKDSIGTYSFASGLNSKAKGQSGTAMGYQGTAAGLSSTAIGNEATANGDFGTALGYKTNAEGQASTAFGNGTIALGYSSTAMGFQTTAGANFSTAIGLYNVAKGYSSTVIGLYNDSILITNQGGISPTTPLFIIGNGDDPSIRSNAMTVLKNGRTGIGTSSPAALLDVNGNTKTNTLNIASGGTQSDFLIKSNATGDVGFRKGNTGLGINYIIRTQGNFPTQGSGANDVAFIGEIKLFAGNFAPFNWAFCNGQLLPVTGNEGLFTLIGTTYGGNGVNNFALPDLRNAVPVGVGNNWLLGEKSN